MGKIEAYEEKLSNIKDWKPYLLKESGLPGVRGNIELAMAVASKGNEQLFSELISYSPEIAPVNSPEEFLAFCGVVGYGRILSEGNTAAIEIIRTHASDPRWRTREAVAMALQKLGDKNMVLLLEEAEKLSQGNLLEKRAAAAALCEPRLLKDKNQVKRVLDILDCITSSMAGLKDRKTEEFVALKKGMAYCWSVAVAAYPEDGKKYMEKWLLSKDKDVLWIMKENLKKNRLRNADAEWVRQWKEKMGM